jgi:hypothetical protein
MATASHLADETGDEMRANLEQGDRVAVNHAIADGLVQKKENNVELLINTQREIWNNCISLRIAQRDAGGMRLSVAKPLLFVEQDMAAFSEPCIRLGITEAQKLMDELWNCGLRPSEGTGSAGALAATERHLKDMQRIVFKGYKS